MLHLAKRILLVLLLWLGAAPAPAQEAGERRVIPVSVIDREGKLVEGLTAADFRGEFRGQPARPISLSLDASRRRIAILIDTSGSMDTNPAVWDLLWASAQLAVERLTPTHLLAVGTIGDDLEIISGFTPDSHDLESALRRAKRARARGRSRLTDAVLQLVTELSFGRGDSIIFITDGVDTNSRSSDNLVNRSLSQNQVRVFTVCRDPRQSGRRQGLGEFLTLTICDRLATLSGGRSVEFAVIGSELEAEFAQLTTFYDSLPVFYALEVEFARPVDKPRDWKLEVVDSTGKKRKDVGIVYPRLLVPLDAKPPTN